MLSTSFYTTITDNPLDEANFHRIKRALYNKDGLSYTDFKKTLRPNYKKVWIDIIIGWMCLFIIMCLAITLLANSGTGFKIFICLVASVLIGYIIAYLINFFHEATHYNISENKKRNDRYANIFIGILIGQGIKNYRIVHWQHHASLGTPEDTERSYFESLGFHFFVSSLTGISAFKFLTSRNKFVSANKKIPEPILKKEKYQQFLAGIFFHAAILFLLLWFGQYWLAISWVTGLAGFYPFFNRLRQLIEHRSDNADKKTNYNQSPHGKISRLFGNTVLDKSFGSAGFNKHMLHHLEPAISYTRLAELENFLKETSIGQFIHAQQSSYFKVFKKLLNK